MLMAWWTISLLDITPAVLADFATPLCGPCIASIFCAISSARLSCVLSFFQYTFTCGARTPGPLQQEHRNDAVQKLTFLPVGGEGETVQTARSIHDGNESKILDFCASLDAALIAITAVEFEV